MATLQQDNVITSVGLAPAPTIKTVPQPQDTTNYAGITGGVTESIISDYTNLNNRLNSGEKQQTGTAQGILDVMGELTGKTAFSQGANESAGVNKEAEKLNKYAQQLADLNAQATSLNREAQAIPLQVQEQNRNTGATDRGVAPQEAGALRLNALRALSIGQQSDIAAAAATGSQLRLQAAKDKAQQMVDLKYKPLEEALAIKQKQYELNKDILASIDKKRTEALTVSLAKEAKDLEEAKAREKSIQDILTTAGIQQAPADLLARAQKAKTPSEAAMILGQYAGDYYKTELLKQQIATEKAQRSKIYADMTATEQAAQAPEIAAWVANINSGKAKLSDVPAKLKNGVSIGLSTSTSLSPEVKAKVEASQAVYDLAQELKTLEGKGGAVGFGLKKTIFSKLPGIDETAIAGTDRANYEAKFRQVKDTLASANLDKLKGAMSDKDIEFLRNVGTALNLDMSQVAFDKELEKIAEIAARVPGVTKRETINPFTQALGQNNQTIHGTSIVNKVNNDGSIMFTIPK